MVFVKRYVFLIFEIAILYAIFLATTAFQVPVFTETLYVFIPFFYFVRGLDDLVDYEKDKRKNKAPLKKGVLYFLILVFFSTTVSLICYFKLWLMCILFALVIHFIVVKKVSSIAKMLLLPTSYLLFIYFNATFELVNICMVCLFFILSLLYAIYKKNRDVEFYDDYTELTSIGGKAYHLRYAKIKNTPAYFTIPYEFFKDLEKEEKKLDALKAKIQVFCKKNQFYAVRSSAIDEDSLRHSFAGIHTTKLNVKKEDILSVVLEVYQSAFTPLALEYRKMNQLPVENIHMAVVVQSMVVDPDYAGVIYTINPKTDDPDEIMISLVKGLGEELVHGDKDSKDYFISSTHIKGDLSFISLALLKQLEKLAHTLQKKQNAFLDIEFAIKGKKVYFLQSRPIATYAEIHPKERTLLIDNSNLIESYYGTTSHLTQSFAKSIYEGVYTKTLEAGHVRKKIMSSLEDTLKNMLFSYEGKLYYNLNSWYHLTSIFPMKGSTSYMEQMMGVSSGTRNYKKIKLNLIDMLKIGVCFLYRLHTMEAYSKAFIDKFNAVVLPYYGHILTGTCEELIALYHQIEEDILSDFATPILNDCAVMFYTGRLMKKINKKYPKKATELFSACIQSGGTMESALVCKEYQAILQLIQSTPDVLLDFKEKSPEALYKKYHTKDLEISKKIQEYILHFGSRVMNELKLETTTMIENPVLAYKHLQEGLSYTQEVGIENHPIELPKNLRRLAKKTRYFLVNRERLRLKRTYIFSVVRNIFLAIGRSFEQDGKLSSAEDIFYLTKDEIFQNAPNSLELVQERKKELVYYDCQPYYSRVSFYPNRVLPVKRSGLKDTLKGLSTGKSIVTGKVSILHKATDPFPPGNIIVAARTDPGWISLFPLASGLIVEHGSMLSHSFVVAREMGLPAIVGIPNITSILKDGDVVTLDSVEGVIRIEK